LVPGGSEGLSPYRAVNTVQVVIKTILLVLHKAKFAAFSEIHTTHTNSMWSQFRIFECQTLWYVKLPVGIKRWTIATKFVTTKLENFAYPADVTSGLEKYQHGGEETL
jgi:hypothetical protein